MIAPIDFPKPPPPMAVKRVILIDSDGLPHIIGVASVQPDALLMFQVYEDAPPVSFSLIGASPRSYIYREIVPPQSSKFGEFNPNDGMRAI